MKKIHAALALAALLAGPATAEAKRYSLVLDYGQDVLVAGKDDLNIRAQCVENEGGLDVARIYAVTQDNAVAVTVFGDTYYGNGSYLTSVAVPADSELLARSATSGVEAFLSVLDGGFVLNLTTQNGFGVSAESAIIGLNLGDGDCHLSFDLDKIKKFKAAK